MRSVFFISEATSPDVYVCVWSQYSCGSIFSATRWHCKIVLGKRKAKVSGVAVVTEATKLLLEVVKAVTVDSTSSFGLPSLCGAFLGLR